MNLTALTQKSFNLYDKMEPLMVPLSAYNSFLQTKTLFMKATIFTILLLLINLFLLNTVNGQDAVNDYRTNAATFSWSTITSWQRCTVAGNPGTWATASAYPGQSGTTNKVTIRDGHSVTLNVSPAQAIGSLVVGEGATGILRPDNSSSRTLTVSGNVSIAAGGTFNLITGGSNTTNILNVGGDFTNAGIFDGNLSGTRFINVTMNGGALQTISGTGSTFRFNNLTISNTTASVNANNNFNLIGTLTVNSNAAFSPAEPVVINSAAAAGTITGSGTIQVSRITATADYVNQYKFSTNTLTSLRVEYSGAGDQTVNSTLGTYGSLICSNSGIKSLQGNINVSTALQVDAGVTLALNAFTLGATTDPNSLIMECGAITGSSITGTGALYLGGNATINNNGGGTSGASIACPIILTNDRTFTVADDGTAADDLTISGIISGATRDLTKSGAGKMLLSGVNTYSGITTLNAGVLSVATIGNGGVAGNLGAASSSAGNLIFSGGTLEYTGTTASTNRSFTLSNSTTTTFDIVSATLTISGTSSSNSGGLIKTGAGTLLLAGGNLHTGLTTITDGTLQYGIANALSNGGVTVNGGTYNIATFSDAVGTVTLISGAINGTTGVLTGTSYAMQSGTVSAILAGSVGLTKTTSGTVTLSGVNTYTGATIINAGILSVGTIGNGGVSGNMGAASTTASNLVLGGGTLEYSGATASSNRNFTLSAGTTSTINITTNDLTISGASTATTGALIKDGSGTLILSGNNLHTGTTTIADGALKLGASERISNSSALVVNATFDMAGFSETVSTFSGNGSVTSSTGGSSILTTSSSSNSTFSGNMINGSGTLSLIKQGSGTLTLSGSNSYSGGTTISAGAISLGASGVLDDSGPVVLNGGTFNSGGFNETAGTLSLQTTNSIINLAATLHTLNFAASNLVGWTAARTITINGWMGGYNGTSGTNGQIFVGGAPGNGLTAGQLSQIQFFNGSNNIPAIMLSTGEVVPSTVAPSALSYSSPNVFGDGSPITALNPTVTGVPDSYSVSPALPAGLNLNTSTGDITGTPSVTIASALYTVTATNIAGSTTFDIDITVIDAQASTDNFRSKSSGIWSTAGTWERSPVADGLNWATASAAPTSSTANAITVRNGHTVTISATVSIDQTIVEATGQINLTAGTLTIADGTGTDLEVSGNFTNTNATAIVTTGTIVFEAGSVYHDNVLGSSTIPTASWNPNSTFYLDSWSNTANVKSNLSGQTFGHFSIGPFLNNGGGGTGILLPSGGTITCLGDFIINNGGSQGRAITFNSSANTATLNVSGDFTLLTNTSDAFVMKSGTGITNLFVNKDFSNSNSSTNFTGSTVTFNGTAQSISGTSTTAFGTMTILNGSTVTGNTASTATIANIDNGGKYIQKAGNVILGSTTKNFVSGSTYELQTAGVTFSGNTYGNLIFNFTGASSLNLTGILTTVANDLTVLNTGTAALRFASSQSPAVAIAGDLIINGGNVEGSSSTGVPVINVAGNLQQTGGSLKLSTTSTGGQQLNVTGNVQLDGGTFQPMSSTGIPSVSVKGNWTKNGGGYTPGSVTVTFNGSGTQNINGSFASTFYNLVLNNSTGFTLNGLFGVTVSNVLTLTNGAIDCQLNTLSVTNSAVASVVRTNGYAIGNLQRAIATGTNSYTFPVGTVSGYTPATIALTSVAAAGSISVVSKDGSSINYPVALSATKKVNRFWTVTNTTVAGFNANATFTYLPGDLVGGAVFSNLKAYKYDGGYSYPVTQSATASTFSFNGLNAFSEFGAGECDPITVLPITGGPGSMCVGTTVLLADATSGGVWSSDNSLIASVDVNGLVTANAGGSTTIRYTVTAAGGSGCYGESTVAITVIANSTISLSSVVNSDAQSVCINTAITDITYTIGGSGTGASITAGALPSGVTGAFAAGVFTISGTPTVSGNFSYTITTTGPCVNNSAGGTITVNPNAEILLTSAVGTNGQSVCNNTSIQGITYAITGGGSGAGVTGLPSGVTGLYNAGVFTISGIPTVAGTFNYVVTTTGSCIQTSANGSIVVNAPPTATYTKTNYSVCGAASDGAIAVTPAGGTAPYSYSWTGLTGPGGNNLFTAGNVSSLSGLDIGYYNVTVTDALGCSVTITGIHISYAFSVYITSSGSISAGCTNTGSIILYGNSGVLPYSYSLDGTNYQSGNTFTNLAAGLYTAYVKDAAGCASTKSILVDAAPPIVVNAYARAASSCSNDGSIELYRTGGIPPYTYSLDDITYQTSNKFNLLAAGNYVGYVKDSKGCKGLQAITITQGAALVISASKTNTSTCMNDGSMQLNPSGGIAPFTYSMDDVTYQVSNSFSGLAAGTYTGWAKDSKGCKGFLNVTINLNPINVTYYVVNASNCASNNGSIQLFRTGGVGPYTYSLDGNNYQSSTTFTNLAPGTYDGYVKDVKTCIGATLNIVVGPACGPVPGGSYTKSSAGSLEVSEKSTLKINAYPNPANAAFTLLLESSSREKVSIIVTDLMGRKKYQSEGNLQRQYQFGNDFAPGIYMLMVIQGNEKQSIKLIKE